MSRQVSQSFELRYFSSQAAANGETDFKGQTAVFCTEDRIEYLRQYARHARKFFANEQWDHLAVADEEIDRTVRSIKQQPSPSICRHIRLESWKRAGDKLGKRERRILELQRWRECPDVELADGALRFTTEGGTVSCSFAAQSWRLALQWRVRLVRETGPVRFRIGAELEIGRSVNGQWYCRTDESERECGAAAVDRWTTMRVEIDLQCSGFNLYIDDGLRVDFADWPSAEPVAGFSVSGHAGMELTDLLGVGFTPRELGEAGRTGDKPFDIVTFLDESFTEAPDLSGWADPGYDDSAWAEAELPHAHGGERYAGESLYMRTSVHTGDFQRAYLTAECLDPGGEIWINGQVVRVMHKRHPLRLDVTPYLLQTAPNTIAVRIYPNEVEINMRHTSTDRHTGWFAGRMQLELTSDRHIEDVFVYCRSLHDDMAVAQLEISLKNDIRVKTSQQALDNLGFSGTVGVEWTRWFPEESEEIVASEMFPVTVEMGRSLQVRRAMRIPGAQAWTPDRPYLYRVRVKLYDSDGTALDDRVITTGLRTVGQEGGVFRINGRVEMMNGALVFGYRYPIERIAVWDRCSPAAELVRDILMLKRMNGNTARMSQHNSMIGGINDPRYAEIGDQLGILFQWATSAWVRDASPWLMDTGGLPHYIRQVRNHPSIVMWQPSNHPSFEGFDAGMPWYEEVYEAVRSADPSRLIAPAANLTRLKPRSDDGTIDHDGRRAYPVDVWTAPGLTRGNMDGATGYGAEWSVLRKWPFPPEWEGQDGWRDPMHKSDFLHSAERAYFEYENEESVGQANWQLHRGKPYYRLKSYEWDYDRGSIGRELSLEEWEESQAWQAFSAYESIRKKRWLGYDGFAWCTLRGGGNNGTYMKPLTDYRGYAKMAYYAVAMGYQRLLAGSGDVDIVYGPDDSIRPLVLNAGPGCRVDLHIAVLDAERRVRAEKRYEGLTVAPGKTILRLEPFRPELPGDGYYAVEYRLVSHGD